jgi:large subunit ribosomal protein L22
MKIQGKAVAKNIKCSPYKLRPVVDVIRNKDVLYALNWLQNIYRNKKALPIRKVIDSALANFLCKNSLHPKTRSLEVCKEIFLLEIKVDQGLIRKYFQPGPQGRAKVLRTRYSHISVVVGNKMDSKIHDSNKIN